MRPLTFAGISYPSLAAACRELGLPYKQVRLLSVSYSEAQADPGLAIAWHLHPELRPTDMTDIGRHYLKLRANATRAYRQRRTEHLALLADRYLSS